VSVRKRVQKIETSLPPKEMGLFWLEKILEFGQNRQQEDLWADPRCVRLDVAQKIGEAVNENLADPPLRRELLDQAVREAQKQTDTLMVLILDVHEHVSSESRIDHVSVDLVLEKYWRLLERGGYKGEFDPVAWDSWRAMLINKWTAIICLRKLVDSISETCFDGHTLLFAEDEELLNGNITALERMAKMYNDSEHDLAARRAIHLDTESPFIAEHVKALTEFFVSRAKGKTLSAFGERDAATKLLDSCESRLHREVKRLRSLGPKDDSVTC
jgi:hypothetical protein